jgi:hypothetical protein
MYRFRLTIAFSLTMLSVAQAADLPTFPITAWWAPPGEARALSTYREAHFNVMLLPGEVGSRQAIRAAERNELPVLLANPSAKYGAPTKWGDLTDGHPNIAGFVLEQTDGGERLSETLALARASYSGATLLVSCTPTPGEPTIPDTFSLSADGGWYRRFVFDADGHTDEAQMYGDLAAARAAAQDGGTPLWGMIHVTEHGAYRRASESDIRVQVYSALAYGARGLCYHTYWGPSAKESTENPIYADWGAAMIDPDSRQKRYAWKMVQPLNHEVLTLAPALAKLRSTGIYFVGDVPDGGTELPHETLAVHWVLGERVLVGLFEDEQNRAWVLLVNRRYGKQRSAVGRKSTLLVKMGDTVGSVVEIDRHNGSEKPIALKDGQFAITLPGGTGSLLRLAPTYSGVEE